MRFISFFVLMLSLVCAGHARVPPDAGVLSWRKGEFFHREVTVANTSAAQFPTIDIGVGGPETAQGELFVPLTPEAFQYTNGKLTRDGRWTYSYDGENRLVAMEAHNLTGAPAASRKRLEFTYDYAGRRIRKIVKAFNATTQQFTTTELDEKYVYDGWNLLAIIDTATGNKKRTFMWGLDLSQTEHEAGGVGGLLQVTDYSTSGGTSSHFAAYDGNGNVVGLVNASSGRMSALYEYGPFGEPLRATGPMAALNPIRFSSKFTDNESGLLYYGYRFYNPSTGRWLNHDPIEELGGLNLHGFVGNNPLRHVDPNGLDYYYYYSSSGSFYPSGSFAYLGGETKFENVTSGFYNVFPAVFNGFDRISDAIADGLDMFGDAVAHATGYPEFGDGSKNVAAAASFLGLKRPVRRSCITRKAAGPLPPGEAPYQLKLFPDEAYNRVKHYGHTPTPQQRASVPTGMEFDHNPTLIQHYYEGVNGGLPGFNLTQTERLEHARSLLSGRAATPAQQRVQGGAAATYSREQKRLWGLE